MKDRRLQIIEALESVTFQQRHRDFQWLGVQVAKTKWPELEATQEQNDGGEDATSFFKGSDGKRRYLACSLTGTLDKIKKDAARLRERKVEPDILVFITPVPVTNLEISAWCEAVQKEFNHELHVIPQAELVALLEQPKNAWLCRDRLNLPFADEPRLAELEASARSAAAELLEGWKKEYHYGQTKPIELAYVQETPESERCATSRIATKHLSLHDLSRLLHHGGRATLVGPPGAGKTFTLIQLTDLLLRNAETPAPILVSTPGWAAIGGDFVPYVAQQLAAFRLDADSLAKLAISGRVTFLLNGWNEIPEGFVDKANSQLRAFLLNNPAVSLILSTRETRVATPLSSASLIHVRPLSPSQKREIINKCGLADPSTLFRELETNVALSEVTDIPLFLASLINLARAGEPLPATRSGILRSFIQQSEANSEHSAALNAPPCAGFHRTFLNHVAQAMTQAGATTLDSNEALAAVAKCSKALEAQGHFPSVPHSSTVVDCLVKHHLLVLSPSLGGAYRFVHQQFQEWFAAEWLYRCVTGVSKDEEPDEVFKFQRDILNHIRWKQPLFFLFERFAEGGDDQFALAAKVIRWAMSVDLLLAAMFAGVAGEHVWPLVRDELTASIRGWYERSSGWHRHCAVAAMLATHASEFQDVLWPLLESNDQQVRLRTYRTWRPFPLTSLGSAWRQRFDKWDSQRRTEFIREISWQPSQQQITLACELAKTDNRPDVRLACLSLFKDIGAYETFAEIIDSPAFGKWANDLSNDVLPRLPKRCLGPFIPRLKAALAHIQALDARRAIIAVLQKVDDPDWLNLTKAEVNRILEAPDVEFRPINHWQNLAESKPKTLNAAPYIAEYLNDIYQAAPDWATDWLTRQLMRGQFWWEPFADHFADMPEANLDRVAEAALDIKLDVNTLQKRAALLGRSGSPIAAKALVKEYLAFETQNDTAPGPSGYDRGDALQAGICELPIALLVDTIIEEAKRINQAEPLYTLLRLVMPRAPLDSALRQLSVEQKTSFRSLVFRLDEMKLADPEENPWLRAHLAVFLGVVGIPADAKILEEWILDEHQRRAEEDAEWRAKAESWKNSGRTTHFPRGRSLMSYSNWYQGALVQLQCPESAEVFLRLLRIPEWLGAAAWGLVQFTRTETPQSDSLAGRRPKYDEIYERRRILECSSETLTEVTKFHAEAIFQSIQGFLQKLDEADSRLPRHQLLSAAAAFAELNDTRAIPLLLEFSSDKDSHWTIASAFHGLALRGISIPGKKVAEVLEPFIREQEKQSWGSNDPFYVVVQCLALLLFSDAPSVGVERIRRLPDHHLKSYHVREVLELLAFCRAPEAARLLVDLADSPEIQQNYFCELVEALSENGHPDAGRCLIALLDQACSGELRRGHDTFEPLAKAIAHMVKTDHTIWADIKSRCSRASSAVEREILSQILNGVGNADAALTLCDLIHEEFPINYHMVKLVENAVTNHVPAGGGAYYLKPRAATDLRKQLIGIARSDVTRRRSALELLAIIAQCRLEQGSPANEPIHPDIATVKGNPTPWQILG